MFDKFTDWCMDNTILFTILLVSFVLLPLGILAYNYNEEMIQEIRERNIICAEKGGELLERTYRVGKTNRSEYVCVDKKIIIE